VVEGQDVRLLDLLQRDVALDVRHAGEAEDAFHHQFGERLQVWGDDAQEVIGVTRH